MKNSFYKLVKVLGISALFLFSTIGTSQNYTLYAIIGDYLASIDHTTGDATQITLLTGSFSNFGGLAYEPNLDKLFAVADRITNPKLVSINRCTGEVTEIGLIDQQSPFLDFKLIESMDYNPDDGLFYAAGYELSVDQNWFYSRRLMTIDPLTGDATVVSNISGTCQQDADALAFSSNGKYLLDGCPNPTSLYSINLANGNSTLIGTNNLTAGAILATHPKTGELYTVSTTNRQLYNLSTLNGAATLIGQTHTSNEFDGGLVVQITYALNSDSDSDGICDVDDNCINVHNPNQQDSDYDGFGDVCDSCPLDPDNDIDGDDVCGDIDNCPSTSNPNQLDSDCDGVGDVCDRWDGCDDTIDSDSDGTPDCIDLDELDNWECHPNGKKAYVCHIPPGNPDNAHTICISKNAVSTHLNNHGDYLGECDQIGCDNNNSAVIPNDTKFSNHPSDAFTLFPNPTSGELNLVLKNYLNQEISVSIHNVYGKQLFSLPMQKVVNPIMQIDFAYRNLPDGIYLISVNSNNDRNTKQFILTQ